MILGINYSGYHDSAIALLNGSGRIIYAASEERFSRVKKDGHFPQSCLSRINLNEVTDVAVPYLPNLPPEPKPDPFFSEILLPRNRGLSSYPPEWRERLDSLGKNLIFVDHHLSHAACGFFLSGFEDALIVTADYGATNCLWNMGIYKATSNDISSLHSSSYHHFYPLCALYSDVTALLGFRPNVHEGKITGLAAYGEDDPICEEKLWAIFCEIHSRAIPLYYWTGWLDETSYPSLETNPALAAHYRAKLSEFSDKQIAHAAQRITERKLIQLIARLREEYASSSIILSGGLFANVKLNLEVKRQGFKNIFICPPMGDEGLAIGAAVLARKELYGASLKGEPVRDLYFGTATLSDAKDKLAELGMVYSSPENLLLKIATLLSEGKIVALVKEGMEFGPRSLGHRSILYQATDPTVNDWLNKQLKRTEFMPFAPIVRAEHAAEYFDPVELSGAEHTAQFMTICFHCRDMFKVKCPAVVHVDGTARPQLVDRQSQPELHSILSEYERLTGLPALINTSFNVHDEPIVASVADAVVAFFQSGLDYLVIDQYLISREENSIWCEAAHVMPGQALQVHKSIHRSAMAVLGIHIADLDAAKTSLELHINHLLKEMAGQDVELVYQARMETQRLHEELDQARMETQRLHEELDQARTNIAQAEEAHRTILASFSWRLTAPLRAVRCFLGLVRGVILKTTRRFYRREPLFQEVTPPENAVGFLDVPQIDSVAEKILTVSGWLMFKNTIVKSVFLAVDDQPEVPITYGHSRPDVAQTYPGFPHASTAGFVGYYSINGMTRNCAVLTIWAKLEDGTRVKCFTRRIILRALPFSIKSPLFVLTFLLSSAKKGWRAFRNGHLPFSPSLWLRALHRNYELILARQHDHKRMIVHSPKIVIKEKKIIIDDDSHISIIIPTFNGMKDLAVMVPNLLSQKGLKSIEVVVVDSGSTDRTVEVCRKNGAKVIEISQKEFSHSYARNLGSENATKKYLLFMVQDALPSSDLFVYYMLRSLKKHSATAASCGEFLRMDADLFAEVQQWGHYRFLCMDEDDKILSLPEKTDYANLRKNSQLSDVACLIEKDVFLRYKYRNDYAEDLDLGLRLIKDKYRLVYVGTTKVIHSHTRPPYYFLKRSLVDNASLSKLFSDFPKTKVDSKMFCEDIIFMFTLIEEVVSKKLICLETPCKSDVIKKIVIEYLDRGFSSRYPIKIAVKNTPYVDSKFLSFVKSINEEYDPKSEKLNYHGKLLADVKCYANMTFDYLLQTSESIDNYKRVDIISCLYKILAIVIGTQLSFYDYDANPEKRNFFIQLKKELTEGV